jgi:hypothetical protein
MLYRVVDSTGKETKGYLVDDIFIKSGNIKYLTYKNIPNCKSVIGKCHRQSVEIDSFTYKDFTCTMCYANYRNTLDRLKANGFKLNDIIFVRCTKYDLDLEDLSPLWEVTRALGVRSGIKYYVCVSGKDFSELAYIMTKDNLFTSKSVHISMIEVFDKNKGYGSSIINTLVTQGKTISGISAIDAKRFWGSVGASFSVGNSFVIS